MIDVAAIPVALYVHLPWCVRRCGYCDFNAHALPAAGLPEEAYLEALLADLRFAAADAQGRRLTSVFFGGGTPSLFSPRAIGRVLDEARATIGFVEEVEVTLEANPGTVEHGRFEQYAAAGVNRVSLGAQSFDDRALATLGRIHSSGDVARAVGEVRRAGITNFNLDLMYGLPGQDLQGALADVERALDLGPTHVSHYQLTLEPETPFARRPPPGLPDDELGLAMQEACQQRLAEAGFEQYEVSAYAQAGHRCRHNLAYWQYADYLGIGAGAHGKVTRANSIERTVRVRHPSSFLTAAAAGADAGVLERREVPASELPFEFCLNALRLNEGFRLRDFERRTGLARQALAAGLDAGSARRLLEQDPTGRWRATELGRRFLNDLQALFLPN